MSVFLHGHMVPEGHGRYRYSGNWSFAHAPREQKPFRYRFFAPYLASHCPNVLIDPESTPPEAPSKVTPLSAAPSTGPAAPTDDCSTGSSSNFSFNNSSNPPASTEPQEGDNNTACISSAETSPSSSPLRGESSDAFVLRGEKRETLTRKVSMADAGRMVASTSEELEASKVATPVTPAAGSVSVLTAAATLEKEAAAEAAARKATQPKTRELGVDTGETSLASATATEAATGAMEVAANTRVKTEAAATETATETTTKNTTTNIEVETKQGDQEKGKVAAEGGNDAAAPEASASVAATAATPTPVPPPIPPSPLSLHVTYGAQPFEDAGFDPDVGCPPGGTWKGFFENTPKKNGKVFERFVLYINKKSRSGEGDKLMRCEGSGSNKFGTFTLDGTFDPVTCELIVNRAYLRAGTKVHHLAAVALNMSSAFNHRAAKVGSAVESGAASAPSVLEDDGKGNMKTRKKLLSWQKGGEEWNNFDDYADLPQTKSRKLSIGSSARSSSVSKGLEGPEDLYGVYNPGSLAKSSSLGASKANQHPLPKLQKSKLLAPSLPDPRLCRWRSAFYFDAPTNKEVYEGEMLNNMRDGRGVFLYRNGNTYEGQWKKNYEHGYGILFNKKCQVIYSGEFDKGKLTGKGTYNFLDGGIYVGEWRENMRHGSGEYRFPNGAVYIGDWKEDKFWGKGKFWWAVKEGEKDSSYDGDWQNSVRHGKGRLILANGFVYSGQWSHDMIEGKGALTYPDGQAFEGQFVRGKRDGRGTVTFVNGATYEGRFKDDEIIGGGTFSLPKVTTAGKDAWLVPINIADITHVHQKAGFTSFGG